MVAKERKFHAVRLLHSRNQLGRQPLHDSGKGLAIPAVKLGSSGIVMQIINLK